MENFRENKRLKLKKRKKRRQRHLTSLRLVSARQMPLRQTNKLMSKYDNEEQQKEFLKSPAYKAQLEKKKSEEIEKQMQVSVRKLRNFNLLWSNFIFLEQLDAEKKVGIKVLGKQDKKQINASQLHSMTLTDE